jgi:hypothetical protein
MEGNVFPAEIAQPIVKWASMSGGMHNGAKILYGLRVLDAVYVHQFVLVAFST